MKKFALIGAAGYIAVRHMAAIKDTNNVLLAALDKSDSVGIIDSYFPDADFFIEYERFDRHLEKLRRNNEQVDYISICTPNYLHDSHIRFALRQGAHAICEKPLVLNTWNVEALEALEKESGLNIYTILQLRLHPSLIKLKKEIDEAPADKKYEIDLTYITSRGHWYFTSWKAKEEQSGGIATNIGVHFFDMLTWIFGAVKQNIVHVREPKRAAGFLELEKARVRWYMSLDINAVPQALREKGQRTFRSITVEGREIEFSGGFTNLHTKSYEDILKGGGFHVHDAKQSIQTVFDIRNCKPIGLKGDYHPFAKIPIEYHPFMKKK
ncbi:MAG: oxidoreductase [Bacteroidia bacterium]|nr:MAG: oxidoreductase [Bacteroidia bacterium]